jgi:hypothetical protein
MTRTKRFAMVASVLPVLAGLLVMTGGSAHALADADTTTAASGFQVANTEGLSVHVRSGPDQGTDSIGVLAEGEAITITCQKAGSEVNGTTRIWDKLDTGGYISDYYTTTPGIGNFSPGLAKCDSAPPPPRCGGPVPYRPCYDPSAPADPPGPAPCISPTGACIRPAPTAPPSKCPPGQEYEMVPFFFIEIPMCAPPQNNAEHYPHAPETEVP